VKVTWRREGRSRIAHAFAEVDVSAGFEHIGPLTPYGRFAVYQLQDDQLAERRRACERAVQERP
jgi:hypothetical protein